MRATRLGILTFPPSTLRSRMPSHATLRIPHQVQPFAQFHLWDQQEDRHGGHAASGFRA